MAIDEDQLDRIGTSVQASEIEETRIRSRRSFFDPKTTYIPLGIAGLILVAAFRYGISYSDQSRRMEKIEEEETRLKKKMEREAWTTFDMRLWEQEMRGLNPTLHIPKSAEIHNEAKATNDSE